MPRTSEKRLPPPDPAAVNQRAPNPVDIHVGARVRMRRLLIGMSQEKMAERLGLTFQQVQKYEKGTNRISASRLWQLSRTLDVPVGFFFEDLREDATDGGFAEPDAPTYTADIFANAECVQIARVFSEIREPRVRRRLLDLAQALTDRGDGLGSHPSS